MGQTMRVLGDDPAVRFAATELKRYLGKATGKTVTRARRGEARATFTLGVCEDVGVRRPRGGGRDDDWVRVKAMGAGYVLSGSNGRSVLFAVYRYLEACGFRWLRPGRDGEVIAKLRSGVVKGIDIDDRPDHAYRSVCIEGSCSVEHVIAMIDWQAKKGMNSYFIQFDQGTEFFRRWYDHADNPTMEAEAYDSAAMVARVIDAIKQRGMRFERMGHGWTCGPIGLPGEGWDRSGKVKVRPSQRKKLAMVNGTRGLWKGVPLDTNLCYSNPTVRAAMAKSILAYARDHGEVDAIHVWLADGSNNNCECANCSKARLADWYVDLLNEVDERLTGAGLNTRIVFLIYVDLFWPPLKRRLKRPERFLLMFAPITRSYLSSFKQAAGERVKMKRHRVNQLEFPTTAAENIAYLRAWRKQFKGDGFDFDYHAIWACYFDLAQVTLSRTLYDDIRGLNDIGLQGLISCQVQRQWFPHGLLMNVTAEALWDKRQSFKRLVDRTFDDAYGRRGAEVAAFFVEMSRLGRPYFEPVHMPERGAGRIRAGLRNLKRMRELIETMAATTKRETARQSGAVRQSWRLLGTYLQIMRRLVPAFESYLRVDGETRERFEAVIDYVHRQERSLHAVFDVDMFVKVSRWRVHEAGEAAGATG